MASLPFCCSTALRLIGSAAARYYELFGGNSRFIWTFRYAITWRSTCTHPCDSAQCPLVVMGQTSIEISAPFPKLALSLPRRHSSTTPSNSRHQQGDYHANHYFLTNLIDHFAIPSSRHPRGRLSSEAEERRQPVAALSAGDHTRLPARWPPVLARTRQAHRLRQQVYWMSITKT